ncbi:MAG: NAD(P)-dependent oxidoreductase [Egibacteraceae bacterium]
MHMRNDRSRVTVIGLGRMGSALAEAFLKEGYATTVWNRSAGKADDLVARGAVLAATVAEAVSASDLVVVCVLDHHVAHGILDPVGDVLQGRALVNLTSGAPEQARETAAWAAERGASYLDGAIMAIPQGIGRPEAVILYSGSQAALTTHQAALAKLGTSTYLGADAGLAALYDLALLGIMWSTLSGFYHAAALLGTEKVTATDFAPMAVQWLSVVASLLPEEAREIDEGDYRTDVSTLEINALGLGLLVDVSRSQGISADVPGPLQAFFERRVAEGHGADSVSSVIELIKRPA